MTIELVEIEPGRFRVKRDRPQNVARSDHPVPYVISDEMPLTEQVDGRFYTSKRAFRSVGRQLGLTEVGTEKFVPKTRSTDEKQVKVERRGAIQSAIEKYRAGQRSSS